MDFFRLNRRMHNKSFTVDRAATIIGGRNIGDEYFGARAGDLFADLDVLAVGRIAAVVADDFERYWQSTAAFAAETLLADVAIQSAAERAIRLIELRASGRAYLDTIAAVPPILADGVGDGFEWVRVKMVSDDPDKVKGRLHRRQTLVGRLDQILERPRVEMGLVSGYFVPGRGGAASFVDLARQGVAITVLTNSVRATDVAIVHAGYLRYRRRLLRAGIRLYELCGGEPLGGRRRGHRRGRLRRLFIASGAETFGKSLTQSNRHQPAIRSSGSVLHAKTFTIDRERIFIGSFNLDPRSRDLNTELGFLIESPHLAGELSDMLAEARALEVYELELTADGRLCWVDWRHGTAQRHFVEPGTTRAGRLGMRLLALLPIEWML
jgi:putative cardiolipin synthase